jgi:hypothetical protein
MANHVYQDIDIEGNQAVQDAWESIVNAVKEEHKQGEKFVEHYPEYFVEHLGMPEHFEEKSYDWYIDNVGAKWAHMEDLEPDYIRMCSAWRPCFEFCDHIARHLGTIDPDVKVINRYEDEFFNFVGTSVHEKDTWDYDEMEWDEIKKERLNILNMTTEQYEDEDYEDEELYEYVSDLKERFYNFLTSNHEDE